MSHAAKANAQSFMMHRAALLELLEQIPADRGDFAAWEGGMSFKRIVDHLSGSGERTLAMLAGQAPGKPEPSSDFAAALARVQANTHTMRETLAGMSDEQLGTVIEAFGGNKMPVAALVNFIIQHEAHHKGQVWMMARMIGLQPPMFVKMG